MPLSQFLDQHNRSTRMEAEALRRTCPDLSPSRLRVRLVKRPLARFWDAYVAQGGWREGVQGVVSGALCAWVEFLKWAKWWELGLTNHMRSGLGAQGSGPSPPAPSPEPPARSGRETLSVVVLTKNEEDKIARCLASVAWADEVVVIDGESTDRTAEICRAFGAQVITHAFGGSFAAERNRGLEHAQGDWVLQIDADDVVTSTFRSAAQALLRQGSPHAALKFNRRSVLLGRVMRYGGWHYAVPNLLRRTKARYEGLVHERPRVEGTVGMLEADIEHHPCEDLTTFIERQNRYTSLQARELLYQEGRMTDGAVMRRLWHRPWKTFWKSYVKKHGHREGLHGLVFAAFYAGIELVKWAKYWELLAQERPSTVHRPPSAEIKHEATAAAA